MKNFSFVLITSVHGKECKLLLTILTNSTENKEVLKESSSSLSSHRRPISSRVDSAYATETVGSN